ncbi:MAG TPA: glycine oxidase ThiO [Rhizomicrobium sp.]|nr:glycine oxidase ThiO [Rhizomicrobium sp.]
MKAVIVGAGVAGLGIGWRLLQAGAAVTILERARPGGGATWAAAGMLAVTAELEDAVEAERQFALIANDMWPDFAAELEACTGRSIAFARSGSLLLARDAAELEVLRAREDCARRIVDPETIRSLVPMLEGAGGLWVPNEAQVDSRALGEALTAAFLKGGGQLVPNEAAVRIDWRDGGAATVLTPYGRHQGDAVVIAAGAWSSLLGDFPITPVKGEMIALSPPTGAALPAPMIWGNGVYLVPRLHQNRLLVGATVEDAGFDTCLTAAARARLLERARGLMPSLAGWPVADHWAGLRPKSPDGLPLLGPAAPNLFVAGGQYRNGILFAPAVARMMADMVLGRGAPDPVFGPAFDPRRFSNKETA